MSTDDSETEQPDQHTAANTINKLARGRQARKQTRKKLTERTWNVLDANEEDIHIKRGKYVRDTITEVVHEQGDDSESKKRRSSLVQDSDVGDVRSIPVEPGYEGIHLHFPLKRPEVLGMLEQFKKGQPLHYRYVAQL